MSARIISASHARALLPMAEAIEVNAKAFQAHYRGGVLNPDRIIMEVKAPAGSVTGHTLFKPAYIRDSGALGLKVVSVFPTNADSGLPTVPGTIVVLDPRTGMLRGLVDGTYVTALRTAAGSGAATRALAKADAKRLVVFGAGAQASAHIAAMLCVRPITHVTVVCRRVAAGEGLRAECTSCHSSGVSWDVVDLGNAEGVRAAVSGADIICSCTSSSIPLFDGSWVTAGTHINAVGSYRPDCAELDAECVSRCHIITDTDAAEECGEIHAGLTTGSIRRESHLVGTLGQLLCGDVKPEALAPTPSQDITLFKSVGVAFQDLATAAAILEKAEELGVGTVVEM